MIIHFLGTGTSQGVPIIGCECEVCRSSDPRDKRFRSSIWIQIQNRSIVIDTGPDFRSQALRAKMKHLDAVCFTHAHKDHTAGFDDIRPFVFRQKKPMPVYGSELTLKQLIQEFAYIFDGTNYPGIPKVELHVIQPYVPFTIHEIEIMPLLGYHYKLPVLGYRINNFAYLTDIKTLPEKTMLLLKGVEVLVVNALRWEPHISHLNVEEALQLIQCIQPRAAYLTHISHTLGTYEAVSKRLPESVFLAYDTLEITIPDP